MGRRVLQGGVLYGPHSRTEFTTGRKNTKQTQRRGRNNKYVITREAKILGRKNTKQTQRQGRNNKYVLLSK